MVEILRNKLMAERRRNLVQEMDIRKEMGDAMLQQLMESEEQRRSSFTPGFTSVVFLQPPGSYGLEMFSRQIEELKESYQEKLESTFEMYKDAIRQHAYQSALSSLEDDYVPVDEFLAEQQKVEVGCVGASASGPAMRTIHPVVSGWEFWKEKDRSKSALHKCLLTGITQLGVLAFKIPLNRNFERLTIKSALQALKRKVSELETGVGGGLRAPPTMDQSCQTQAPAAETWQSIRSIAHQFLCAES